MPASDPVVDSPLVAHRGASLDAPENTLSAIRLAAERGATWVETDVRLTADGGLVMIHDATLDRTTNGTGRIGHMDFADIIGLDSGSWFAPDFAGEPVLDLTAFLRGILDNGLCLQLELKESSGREEALTRAAIDTVKDIWPIGERGLYLSSFSERCMGLAAEMLPEVPRAIATEFVPENPALRLQETRCQILHVQAAAATAELCAEMRAADIEFAVATVNDADDARQFLDAGATSVLSDIPDLLG